MYASNDIARYFIARSITDNTPVTNLKLQKLIYIAHGFHLGLKGKPLLAEQIECWPYGPVISCTYHEYKSFGNKTITVTQEGFQKPFDFDKEALEVLDFTWASSKDLDAIQLSNWTHIDGSPWKRAMDEGRAVIPNNYIEDYFKTLVMPPANGAPTTN